MDGNKSIAVETLEVILENLSGTTISVPDISTFSLVERLQSIPRTGKAVRIDRFGLNLPKQSLVDHIKTLAIMADVFKSALDMDLDSGLLARMAAFHDLAETITGDTPDFTSKELAAGHYMDAEDKRLEEKNANATIADCLTGPLKSDFLEVLDCLEDAGSQEARFFIMLDKLEPIISVWRYINQFRKTIDIENFLEAMTDFFTNPKVGKACLTQDVVLLASFLQDKKMARKYYEVGPTIHMFLQPNVFAPEVLQGIFEQPMECI